MVTHNHVRNWIQACPLMIQFQGWAIQFCLPAFVLHAGQPGQPRIPCMGYPKLFASFRAASRSATTCKRVSSRVRWGSTRLKKHSWSQWALSKARAPGGMGPSQPGTATALLCSSTTKLSRCVRSGLASKPPIHGCLPFTKGGVLQRTGCPSPIHPRAGCSALSACAWNAALAKGEEVGDCPSDPAPPSSPGCCKVGGAVAASLAFAAVRGLA
mmetsp:Transcript_15478/g.41907  ORF Transcript_15478/g.41907 Transcript_15478/m.41907 type:complete len:213 (+) Transcript_15478:773-1411(+)